MSNEALWSQTFGDEYTVRNDKDYRPRAEFFRNLLLRYPAEKILEVGCNQGMNLDIMNGVSPGFYCGCDVNASAVRMCRAKHPDLNVVCCSGYATPFRDGFFDLVFTCGVLIHQHPNEVGRMMEEVVRVSGKYVLAMEYAAEAFEEIPYRGQKEALFKGPYGEIYKSFGFSLAETGFLSREQGFDSVTYWMFKV